MTHLTRRQNEAPSLHRDVPHARLPSLAPVDGWDAVQLRALIVEVRPEERDEVLPADGRADRDFLLRDSLFDD